MKSVNEFCEKLKAVGESDDTPNGRGNQCIRLFCPAERYLIDFAEDFTAEGWQQFDTDQDAHYFGVWCNPQSFRTLTYAEGDWTLVECPDVEHYNAEMQDCINFYGEGRIALVIEQSGRTVEYRQDREEFIV